MGPQSTVDCMISRFFLFLRPVCLFLSVVVLCVCVCQTFFKDLARKSEVLATPLFLFTSGDAIN